MRFLSLASAALLIASTILWSRPIPLAMKGLGSALLVAIIPMLFFLPVLRNPGGDWNKLSIAIGQMALAGSVVMVGIGAALGIVILRRKGRP